MLVSMNVGDCLERLGGLATRAALIRATSRAAVDRALAAGDIVVVARGRYALSSVDDAIRHAHRLSGVLSLTNAALHHGWEVKAVPAEPHVTVRRKRRLDKQQSLGVQVHYADLLPEEITDGIATNREVTLAQCLRQLPDDEALAIADSALRHGEPASTLRRVAQAARGPGAPKVRRIAHRPVARRPTPSRAGSAPSR